jgi:hypothetical protein
VLVLTAEFDGMHQRAVITPQQFAIELAVLTVLILALATSLLLLRLSDEPHRLARNHRILIRAATQLRLGRSAETVLAEVREQCPELLRDYCDIQLTLGAAPVRSVGRIAASA